MKNLIKIMKENNGVISIIIVFILTISLLIIAGELKNQKYISNELDQKLEYTQGNLESAQQPSQIERLGGTAESFRRQSEKSLEQIKNIEDDYEFQVLTYRCFKDQVNRLMNNEEVDEEFCKFYDNLEQYKSKK